MQQVKYTRPHVMEWYEWMTNTTQHGETRTSDRPHDKRPPKGEVMEEEGMKDKDKYFTLLMYERVRSLTG